MFRIYTLTNTEHTSPTSDAIGMRTVGVADAARDNTRFVLAQRSTA